MPRPRTDAGRGASAGRRRQTVGVHGQWSHETELAAVASSAAHARVFVSGLLAAHGLADLVDDIQLVVSELATNAMVHACTPFTVVLRASGDTVLVEVLDESHVGPTLLVARASETSGRGLAIVEALSREWGVTVRASGGKSVWAEFDIASSASTG